MKYSNYRQEKGFTLVEMLIYIAILIFILGAVIQALFLMTSTYRNIKATRSIESSAVTSIDRMTREIRNAVSIDGANSIFNTNPGQLTVVNGTSTIKFYVSNQRLMIDENGVQLGPLTFTDSHVSSLIFRQITSTTTSSAVKIEMTLVSTSSIATTTKNFYTTVILRGSYQ